MDLLDVMLERRSIRNYTQDEIDDEKLGKIIEAALLAPTSRNRNPCEFLIIRNRLTLTKLAKCKAAGSQFLQNANVGIAVFADENVSDTWIEDSSIALTFIQLMAQEQGIGSCWIQLHMRENAEGEDSEKIAREIFDLPENYRIVGIMSLGIPNEKREPKKLSDLDYEKVKVIE